MKIIVIGGGVVGCAIARKLSKFGNVNVVLLEKNGDVGTGATKANSGIIHGGYAATNGTKKAEFLMRGRIQYKSLNEELNFGYDETGALVLAFNDQEGKVLLKLFENGIHNGVSEKSMRILDAEEVGPPYSKEVHSALLCTDVGITSPYEFCIALAENAIANGCDFRVNSKVTAINKLENGGFQVHYASGDEDHSTECDIIVNASGIESDFIMKMMGYENEFPQRPRKGEYLLFARNYADELGIKRVIFQVPTNEGKGILVGRTLYGNLLLGPNAQEVDSNVDLGTDMDVLKFVVAKARKSVPNIEMRKVIRAFSGIRATASNDDFSIIRRDRLISLSGIDSPGLTSSPGLADEVVSLIGEIKDLEVRADYNPKRRGYSVKRAPSEFITDGNVVKTRINLKLGKGERLVCRCEQVTEKEIRIALRAGIRLTSLDSIKRRTRAGMGICQGHFCGKRVREVMKDEYGDIDLEDIVVENRSSRVDIREVRKV